MPGPAVPGGRDRPLVLPLGGHRLGVEAALPAPQRGARALPRVRGEPPHCLPQPDLQVRKTQTNHIYFALKKIWPGLLKHPFFICDLSIVCAEVERYL